MKTRFAVSGFVCALASIHLCACAPQALAQTDDESGDEPVEAAGADAPVPARGSDRVTRDIWLLARVQSLLANRANLGNAHIGVRIEDADNGRVIVDERGYETSHVASNVKLLTTAAVLARLGPNFRYRTSVLAERVDERGAVVGDLYLRGRGDPVLGVADLDDMARELSRSGITSVQGRIVVDDSYFGGRITPPRFDEYEEALDRHAAFRAPVAGLTIERGTFGVIVTPARSGRGPARVSIDPPSKYIQVSENQVITQANGRPRVDLSLGLENGRMQVSVRGQIQARGRPWRFRFRVEDPALHAGHAFARVLADRGIRVRGRVERGVTPPGARVLTSAVSAPLAVIVRRLGKRSDNAVAEALLCTLGAERVAAPAGRAATWEDGVAELRRFLIDDIGLEPEGFRVDNGSGLFGDTQIAPAQLTQVLRSAYHAPRYGPEFMASLSIAGVDGTLRRRLKRGRARGLLRAKTGTLGAVSALSGYASVPGAATLVFSVVHSDLPSTGAAKNRSRRAARIMQNRIAEAIMQYLDAAVIEPEPEIEFLMEEEEVEFEFDLDEEKQDSDSEQP